MNKIATLTLSLIVVTAAWSGGCASALTHRAEHGLTVYCPGAGNIDGGDRGVKAGLESAGWKGDVSSIFWTLGFNPALDQTLRFNARLAGKRLARRIESYADAFPGRPVNLVGLSAGTGVAVWALEELRPGYRVDNVVLLGSSLWHRYDLTHALKRVKGRIYNYYSPHDSILTGPMKIFGTIDGVLMDHGAGAVGFAMQHPQLVNIPWRREYERYGYRGGHVDSTSAAFVRVFIARHFQIMDDTLDRAPATARGSTPPAAPSY
ncbi:MAG: hypothetical protein HRU75_05145 [Planctomycetia bacterium]|nr:MAG: hypothetical protein HRU75_05145 [Planctomycetia bacterium]